MFNYIWRDKISLNLEITHVTFSPEPSFHPYFFLSLYYMCQALSKRFSGTTSFIPWMITIPVFLQGLAEARAEEDLISGRGSRIHVLTYCIDRPQIMTGPALLWSFTPCPQLMVANPLGCFTDILNPTHPNQKSFLLFSQIFSFPVLPLLPWWEWGLVVCQQSDHLNSGSTEHPAPCLFPPSLHLAHCPAWKP